MYHTITYSCLCRGAVNQNAQSVPESCSARMGRFGRAKTGSLVRRLAFWMRQDSDVAE